MDYLKLLENKDYPWIKDRTIFMVRTGSRAYGTHTDNSDQDYKAVVIPPIEYYFGLQSFSEYNNSTNKKTKNTKDDIDVSIIPIDKFVKGLVSNSPVYLEMLFADKEDILFKNSSMMYLLQWKTELLSLDMYKRYRGFAKSEVRLLLDKEKKSEELDGFDYDYKKFANAMRLLLTLNQTLRSGTFTTKRKGADLFFLQRCREGEYTVREALDWFNYFDTDSEYLYAQSPLHKHPNREMFEKIMISAVARKLSEDMKNI